MLADAWSKRTNLTIADALYVVLAEHLDATLVTTDINLSNAPTLRVATIHP
jgi:predicted nucleic acid-binding protein